MASKFVNRLRKPTAAVGLGVRSRATQIDSEVPTITSGTGAPSATTAPNGSMYLRTNAGTADLAIYMRIGGSWVAIVGAS